MSGSSFPMTEEKKSFSVKDRRMFTAEGEVRRPGEGAEAGEETPAAERPAAATETEASPADDRYATPPAAGEPEERAEERPPAREEGPDLPVDFAGFVVSLAAQALHALSEQPPRLREARAMVAILEMLEDKTEGRRTAEESDVLEALLYQLRMGYLERQRAGGA